MTDEKYSTPPSAASRPSVSLTVHPGAQTVEATVTDFPATMEHKAFVVLRIGPKDMDADFMLRRTSEDLDATIAQLVGAVNKLRNIRETLVPAEPVLHGCHDCEGMQSPIRAMCNPLDGSPCVMQTGGLPPIGWQATTEVAHASP